MIDGAQLSPSPDVPCAHEITGQPPRGGLPFGRNSIPVLSARLPRAFVVTYFRRYAARVVFGIQRRCLSGAAETTCPGARAPASPAGPSRIEPAATSTARVRLMASSATR